MKYIPAVLMAALLAGCGSGGPSGPMTERERQEQLLTQARSCSDTLVNEFSIEPVSVPVLQDLGAHNAALSTAFITAARAQPCVFELTSGLNIRIDRAVLDDNAVSPRSGELVTVNYEGRHIDGSVFDSSYARGTPATFPSDRLIAGWVEALPLMRVGEEWTLYIPSALGYGEVGTQGGPIGPNEALTFRLELISVGNGNSSQEEPAEAADTDTENEEG